jgi:hypothetical protein
VRQACLLHNNVRFKTLPHPDCDVIRIVCREERRKFYSFTSGMKEKRNIFKKLCKDFLPLFVTSHLGEVFAVAPYSV